MTWHKYVCSWKKNIEPNRILERKHRTQINASEYITKNGETGKHKREKIGKTNGLIFISLTFLQITFDRGKKMKNIDENKWRKFDRFILSPTGYSDQKLWYI